jgi:hypothetical protein
MLNAICAECHILDLYAECGGFLHYSKNFNREKFYILSLRVCDHKTCNEFFTICLTVGLPFGVNCLDV